MGFYFHGRRAKKPVVASVLAAVVLLAALMSAAGESGADGTIPSNGTELPDAAAAEKSGDDGVPPPFLVWEAGPEVKFKDGAVGLTLGLRLRESDGTDDAADNNNNDIGGKGADHDANFTEIEYIYSAGPLFAGNDAASSSRAGFLEPGNVRLVFRSGSIVSLTILARAVVGGGTFYAQTSLPMFGRGGGEFSGPGSNIGREFRPVFKLAHPGPYLRTGQEAALIIGEADPGAVFEPAILESELETPGSAGAVSGVWLVEGGSPPRRLPGPDYRRVLSPDDALASRGYSASKDVYYVAGLSGGGSASLTVPVYRSDTDKRSYLLGAAVLLGFGVLAGAGFVRKGGG
jgi:hypothetical protein